MKTDGVSLRPSDALLMMVAAGEAESALLLRGYLQLPGASIGSNLGDDQDTKNADNPTGPPEESWTGRPPDSADQRALVGATGEQIVADVTRAELAAFGRFDLADRVQRASLVSDRFGFDVSAPTIGSSARDLEVKTTGLPLCPLFCFFLSRHEYDVGRNDRSWWLVACRIEHGHTTETLEATILGHCACSTLRPFLPADRIGHWTEAAITLPVYLLTPDVPTALP